MLDSKFIRENRDIVERALGERNLKLDLTNFFETDESRRKILSELELLRAERNRANDEISRLLKEKKDAGPKINSMKEISGKIDTLEERL